jgi:hypothetical protein
MIESDNSSCAEFIVQSTSYTKIEDSNTATTGTGRKYQKEKNDKLM